LVIGQAVNRFLASLNRPNLHFVGGSDFYGTISLRPIRSRGFAEFIGVESIGLEPVRDATLLLAPVGQPTNLGRLHDETNRGRSAGIDDDDPPVADKSVDRASERDWIALRKRLDLDVLVDVCADVLGEPVNAPRVVCSRHDVL
jgi:hypothetical protein